MNKSQCLCPLCVFSAGEMLMVGVFELAESGSSCDRVEGLGGDGAGSESGKAAGDAGDGTLQG